MKKFVLAVYSDTLFIALASFILSFAIFRFYLTSFAIALIFAILVAISLSVLAYLAIKRKSDKKFLKLSDEKEIEKLKFHLAMDTEKNNSERILNALTKKNENTEQTRSGIISNDEIYYLSFKLEPVSADEVASLIKKSGKRKKVLLSCSATADAEKLATNFGIRIMDAQDTYLLLKETDNLPEKYIFAEKMAGFKEKLKFRLSKRMYKGYLLSGTILLVFSLFTFFPVYYLIAGGILLCIAVAVKFLGK